MILMVGLAVLLINLQLNMTRVAAQIRPISVSTDHLSFGTVFPGEELEGSFTVSYLDEVGNSTYRIIQKRKPLPPEHSEYPNGGDPDLPGYYRNLCPFLEKVSFENEGDSEGAADQAQVNYLDLSDTWTVQFKVPAIIGQVAQDHTDGFVSISGEYGCDISVDLEACEVDTLWQIGDEEANQLNNPVDELNWPGAFGIFPEFDDPFMISSSTDNHFPYNSNFSNNYAADFDIDFYFYSPTSAQAELILGWGPGQGGSEQKEVLLDSASLGTTPVRAGAAVSGWWEEMERFSDSFVFYLSPGLHTLKLKQLSGDGTIWDYAQLNIISCETL